jgi:hypothetical protein
MLSSSPDLFSTEKLPIGLLFLFGACCPIFLICEKKELQRLKTFQEEKGKMPDTK